MNFSPFTPTTKKSKVSSASSFWADEWSTYDDSLYTESVYDDFTGTYVKSSLSSERSNTIELLRLAAHRRAIANFVNILTNKNIPVKFYQKGTSYTNGTYVVLSAEVKPEKFDVAVGLALHEASHIKLTDFTTFRNYDVPYYTMEKFTEKGFGRGSQVWTLIKAITNWIEDKRIDQYIYTTCPGYREYYKALYNEYFNDKMIDKGLLSDEYTDETIDSYLFRIINLSNPNTKLSKLKGLKRISDLVNLPNIGRLQSTTESLGIAEGIADIIAECMPAIVKPTPKKSESSNDEQNEDEYENGEEENEKNGESVENEEGDEESEEGDEESENSKPSTGADDVESEENIDSNASDDEDSGTVGGGSFNEQPEMNGEATDEDSDSDANGGSTESDEPKEMLSDKAKNQLDKKIQNQKDFLNDEIKKKAVTRKDNQSLDSVEKSGTEMVAVGDETIGGYHLKGLKCVVSKKLSDELLKDSNFPFSSWNDRGKKFSKYNESNLRQGLALGTLLGKRLQVRSEERVTENPRQLAGKIDKRLIAGLGYDYVNVFQTKEVDKFKKANLHISLDGSGSMDGPSWDKSIITTIAICKAASMISNLTVQVSIRGTWDASPYICVAYDSRIDKFDKVKRMFPALVASGTTPEGLCYQAVMDQFVANNNNMDSYFLNICDGQPYFISQGVNYSGWIGSEHTKKMVQKIRAKGVKVMAYYVSESSSTYSGSYHSIFKTMYGDDSRFININDITAITKTLNQLFLTK